MHKGEPRYLAVWNCYVRGSY